MKFSDGTAFIAASGVMYGSDSAGNLYTENFSQNFFLPSSSSEQEYIAKFNSFASMRIRYKVTLSAIPTFKAVVDNDGNFGDNTDISFTLTQQ